jgi:hypothetical protein
MDPEPKCKPHAQTSIYAEATLLSDLENMARMDHRNGLHSALITPLQWSTGWRIHLMYGTWGRPHLSCFDRDCHHGWAYLHLSASAVKLGRNSICEALAKVLFTLVMLPSLPHGPGRRLRLWKGDLPRPPS